MFYYAVGVRSNAYHGAEPLTYSSEQAIAPGDLVEVPLRSGTTLGVVMTETSKPTGIAVKPIERIYEDIVLPHVQLELLDWLREYYPAPLSSHIQLLLPNKIYEPDTGDTTTSKPVILPALTAQQQAAVQKISASSPGVVLLHGDTGTGKTRVYQELAATSITEGRSVIILTPEIGLAPQLVETFNRQFPGRVVAIHSDITRAARDKLWARLEREQRSVIVIGARSALFAPLQRVGLVVVDESHDASYKQDQAPYYEATRVAAKLAGLQNCRCIFGSATPDIADYWHLREAGRPVVRLDQPINQAIQPPRIEIINIKEREHFTRSPLFSDQLLKAIGQTMQQKQQSLIFLNRRGSARLVSCQSCGWQAACPHCAIALTYHADSHSLRCHICGYREVPPVNCPECNSSDITYQKRGTKALADELSRHFPEAVIRRFDSDNTVSEKLEKNWQAITTGEVDILIGTQILSKGLDLPKLALVGVPLTETGASLPDFTADERFYQLLRQVIGRVGRRAHDSRVILQTYHPKSPLLGSIVQNKWQTFYEAQLEDRRSYQFPPFSHLLQLTCVRKQQSSAKAAAAKLADSLRGLSGVSVLGPSPRFYEKKQGNYHWQVVVKAPRRATLLKIIKKLPANWRYNIDPTNLL